MGISIRMRISPLTKTARPWAFTWGLITSPIPNWTALRRSELLRSVAGSYTLADGKTIMPMLDMEVFSGLVSATSYSDWANQWFNAIRSTPLRLESWSNL